MGGGRTISSTTFVDGRIRMNTLFSCSDETADGPFGRAELLSTVPTELQNILCVLKMSESSSPSTTTIGTVHVMAGEHLQLKTCLNLNIANATLNAHFGAIAAMIAKRLWRRCTTWSSCQKFRWSPYDH